MSKLSAAAIDILKKVATGDLDFYQVQNRPVGPDQIEAASELDALYISEQQGTFLHPDDDFEQIEQKVCDFLREEYL